MQSLTASVNREQKDQPFILLKIAGDVKGDIIESFKQDLKIASEVISSFHNEYKKKPRILLDVSSFSGVYDSVTLAALADFANANRDLVEKTASFGGSYKVKMAGEAAIALSSRDNIKIFDTEEDARAWLLI